MKKIMSLMFAFLFVAGIAVMAQEKAAAPAEEKKIEKKVVKKAPAKKAVAKKAAKPEAKKAEEKK